MKNALLVARHELSVTIRRPAYLLTIFGMPILFGLIFGGVGLITARTAMKVKPRVYAVVDSSGVLDYDILHQLADEAARDSVLNSEALTAMQERLGALTPTTRELSLDLISGFRGATSLMAMADADSAREATRRGDLDGAIMIAEDYLDSGRVWSFSQSKSFMDDDDGQGPAERLLRTALVLSLLEGEDLQPLIRDRILHPMNLRTYEISTTSAEFEESGVASEIRKFALPYGFSLLLLMSIMMGGGFLLQGVAEEKENRVMELLLSSVTTDDLMLGKVLGLGACGLIQVTVWLGLGLGLLFFLAGSNAIPDFTVPVDLFLYCLGYFLIGYFMISTLMAGAGSLGNTQRESQQLSTWFTIPIIAPFLLMMVILAEPNGTVARVLTYIPLTTPVTMMMRLPSGMVPGWEIPVSFVVMLIFTWFAVKIGARLFRIGSLMYGKRPNLPEIIKWIRQSGR